MKIKFLFAVMLALAAGTALAESPAPSTTVTFYGGAGRVGGSCALVEAVGSNGVARVIIDCGSSYDEEDRSSSRKNDGHGFGFAPAKVDAFVVTHAHQDHSGRIPELVRAGFKGTMYMTEATSNLLAITLRQQLGWDDTMKRQWRWSTRKPAAVTAHWNASCEWSSKIAPANLATFEGTYSQLQQHCNEGQVSSATIPVKPCGFCAMEELNGIFRLAKMVKYGEEFPLGGLKVKLVPVKHIPGAAAVVIDDGRKRYAFSGDLGSARSRFSGAMEPLEPVDAVFVESTYGDARDGTKRQIEAEYTRFRKTVGQALEMGKTVWIPAFALDRSQRVIAEIARGIEKGEIPAGRKFFYTSTSSRDITAAYLAHPEWFDAEVAPVVQSIRPLFDQSLKRYSMQANCILMTTSGMMDLGTSLKLLPDLAPRNDVVICLVGYQSPAAYGGQLRAGAKKLKIGKGTTAVEVEVNATIENFSCFSGHADAAEIDQWLKHNRKSQLYLIHGDPAKMEERRAGIKARYGQEAIVAEPNHAYLF